MVLIANRGLAGEARNNALSQCRHFTSLSIDESGRQCQRMMKSAGCLHSLLGKHAADHVDRA